MNELAKLEAYLAIGEVKARYCRLLDTKDWAGYADVFTEDFELDTSGAGGPGVIRGRDAAVKMIRASVEYARTAHQVHSPEITLEGDTAQVIWAMQDRVVWDAGRAAKLGFSSLTGYGHYHERYVRQDGRWRIAAQRLTRLHVDYHKTPAG
jgi:3-phenylpropionate/cinnamic acid dioxygenase small subunit